MTRDRVDGARPRAQRTRPTAAARAEDITLFDSTGLAIQDLAIAITAFAKADSLDIPRIDL